MILLMQGCDKFFGEMVCAWLTITVCLLTFLCPDTAAEYELKHPYDQSVMTYRGHSVTQTLIRAYFSPQHSTGQRYIYAGESA